MSSLRYATLALSAVGLLVSQLTNVLPEGKAKTWATIASAFLAGLPINVFKAKPKALDMFDLTPTLKEGKR